MNSSETKQKEYLPTAMQKRPSRKFRSEDQGTMLVSIVACLLNDECLLLQNSPVLTAEEESVSETLPHSPESSSLSLEKSAVSSANESDSDGGEESSEGME